MVFWTSSDTLLMHVTKYTHNLYHLLLYLYILLNRASGGATIVNLNFQIYQKKGLKYATFTVHGKLFTYFHVYTIAFYYILRLILTWYTSMGGIEKLFTGIRFFFRWLRFQGCVRTHWTFRISSMHRYFVLSLTTDLWFWI